MTSNQSDQEQYVAPIDLENCLRMFNGDREVVLGLIGDFLLLLDEQKKNIVKALAASDPENLRKEAHSIKGGAAVLTARPLMEIAADLEVIGRSGDLSGGAETFSSLEMESFRVASCYNKFKEG